MNPSLPLTKSIVTTYQSIYYDHYKPLVKKYGDDSNRMFRIEFNKILLEFGWTRHQFDDYKSIDLMQRLVFEYSHELVYQGLRSQPMTSRPEYRQYDPNYGALRLKCPIRSEDKDKFN